MTRSMQGPSASDGTPTLLTGVQAVVWSLAAQVSFDAANGLRTAAFASGYPGSPLGGLDSALQRTINRQGDVFGMVKHVPAVNEELAAAAVWGSQLYSVTGLTKEYDGVIGMWYGKSPGADRSGDVFKHANFHGVGRNGGVLVVVGDDPSAKSSTMPSDSTGALIDAGLPVLVPGSVQEVIEFARLGYALSRYSGLWVGLRIVTDIADGFGSAVTGDTPSEIHIPDHQFEGRQWVFEQVARLQTVAPTRIERELLYGRLDAARAFLGANSINVVSTAGSARMRTRGIITSGPLHYAALEALKLARRSGRCPELDGVRVLKLGATFPLDEHEIQDFCTGLTEVLVLEEKRPIIEDQVKSALYRATDQPLLSGRRSPTGTELVPADGQLTVERILDVLARWSGSAPLRSLQAANAARPMLPLIANQGPSFCSGCPHNRSTVSPAGSVVGGGVGCHAMVYLEPRHEADAMLPLVPMGAEGAPWIGLASFSAKNHFVQNLGDGTYAHSGSLAIRAAVAAGVTMTFKILYNGAVAMTGGQAVVGQQDVASLSRELDAMGVSKTVVVTDSPLQRKDMSRSAAVVRRSRMAEAMADLAETPGVTAMIYDDLCAAEERRLRKRGALPPAETEVVINERVCEGCGDCSRKSNCVSLLPVETPYGRKTRVHAASCNVDFSCLDGDCPSFVTIRRRAAPTKPASIEIPDVAAVKAALPPAPVVRAQLRDGEYNVYSSGIGGTGVVTSNQILARAARLDGFTVCGLDQTGVSQKAGPVSSHLRIFEPDAAAAVNVVPDGEADLYLAFDAASADDPKHVAKLRPAGARIVRSSSHQPNAAMSHLAAGDPDLDTLLRPLFTDPLGTPEDGGNVANVDSIGIAERLLGDHMVANVVVLGAAAQGGALPISVASIESAIKAIDVNPEMNILAFNCGRLAVGDPLKLAAMVAPDERSSSHPSPYAPHPLAAAMVVGLDTRHVAPEVCELVGSRVSDLFAYQDANYAGSFALFVTEVADADICPDDVGWTLTKAVAEGLHKLMAYKDEYEVARLHLDALAAGQLSSAAQAGDVIYFHLHPPMLRVLGLTRKLRIDSRLAKPIFHLLRSMRRFRGRWYDPFGHTKIRRTERELIALYRDAIRFAIRELTPSNYAQIVDLAYQPLLIRGYEDLKMQRADDFRRELGRAIGEIAGNVGGTGQLLGADAAGRRAE